MKKLLSLSIISIGLVVLVNCSPKTTKSVASESKQTTKNEENSKSSSGNIANTPTPVTTAPARTQQEIEDNTHANTSNNAHPWDGLTPEQQVDIYKKTNDQRTSAGKRVFETSCKGCHELYSPSAYTAIEWVGIMTKMGPKAKLDDGQYMHVASYLVKNAKS